MVEKVFVLYVVFLHSIDFKFLWMSCDEVRRSQFRRKLSLLEQNFDFTVRVLHALISYYLVWTLKNSYSNIILPNS